MNVTGFTLLDSQELKEVGGTASLWEHDVTKAQILSIKNSDENKCFGVNFRTPPADSTGIAHIMEHSVLCGSKRYPVKEPFVELLKGSLQTFLNAFTFPDKTCYPVASANLADFYNLIDVYIDAVFHPLLSESIFHQEGWHIEADDASVPWTYKGVVFNEMKGVYSSPDSILSEKTQQALFPDTLYHFDSGGDPEHIPNLTYQAFIDFHERYYHPSNARFFFWGDDPEEKRFAIIKEALKDYTYRAVDSAIPLQAHIASPVRQEIPYAAPNSKKKCMFTQSWMLGERGDVSLALQMEMLAHILEGLPGSPLHRALITSHLGEETTGCGLATDLRQMYYSTGLSGIAREDIPKAESLIFETLTGLVKDGIPESAVAAAVNTVEFDLRESNTGRFPRGLAAMIHALSTWLYDENPLTALAWEKPLAAIKERIAKGERLFEECIERYFLNNSHKATVILVPDTELGKEREEKEAARVAAFKASQSATEQEALVQETARLKEAQIRPDSPEALATIPALSIADLPKKNAIIPEERTQGEFTFLAHDQPTVGIGYVKILFPLDYVPIDLVPLLPLYVRTLLEVGTKKRDYIALGDSIAATTGGIHPALLYGSAIDDASFFRYLTLSGKAVYDSLDSLFALFHEILVEPTVDYDLLVTRMGQMIREMRAQLEESVQAAGISMVITRLLSRYCEPGAYTEKTSGVTYLETIREHERLFEKDPKPFLDNIMALRSAIMKGPDVLVSATAEASALPVIHEKAAQLINALPKREERTKHSVERFSLPKAEALITQSRINFVGKSTNVYTKGWKYHGSASVILRSLRMGYLWENVRVRGGAYGAFASLDRINGVLSCVSYRDPNPEETLAAYDNMAHYLHNFTPDSAQLTQAIVGAVGELDTYLLPSAKGSTALTRSLAHDTDELRQTLRDEMLATTQKDYKNFAEVVELLKDGDICVLGGQEAKKAAARAGWTCTNIF